VKGVSLVSGSRGGLLNRRGLILASMARADAIEACWEIKKGRGAEALGGNRALTPPAVANGRVLAGTADGRIIQWDAETGAVRFEVSVGAPVHWMPIMAKGLIAAGLEDGSLIVFDTGDAGNDGWLQSGGGPGHNGPERTAQLAHPNASAT
jgi:PQQ-like domain